MQARLTRSRHATAAIAAESGELPRRMGRIFFRARAIQRWSQQQTAQRTGGRVARSTVSDLERGRCMPAFDALVDLADVLHVDLPKLIDTVRAGDAALAPPGDSLPGLLMQACRSEREGTHDEARRLYRIAAARVRGSADGDARRLAHGLSLRLAIVQARLGSAMQAQRHALSATAALDCEPAWATRAYLLAAILMHDARLFDAAELHASRAGQLAEACDHALLSASRWQSARALRAQGQIDRARSLLLSARPLARAADDIGLTLAIDADLSDCLMALGRHEAASELLRRTLSLACRRGTTDDELRWRLEWVGRTWRSDRAAAATASRDLARLVRCCRDARLRYRAEFWLYRVQRGAARTRLRRLHRLIALRARARADRSIDLPACFAPGDPGCPPLVRVDDPAL